MSTVLSDIYYTVQDYMESKVLKDWNKCKRLTDNQGQEGRVPCVPYHLDKVLISRSASCTKAAISAGENCLPDSN